MGRIANNKMVKDELGRFFTFDGKYAFCKQCGKKITYIYASGVCYKSCKYHLRNRHMLEDGEMPHRMKTIKKAHMAVLNKYTIEGDYAYCKACSRRVRFLFDNSRHPGKDTNIWNCKKHLRMHRKKKKRIQSYRSKEDRYLISPYNIQCPYCWVSGFSSVNRHMKQHCIARREFEKGGLGTTLRELTKANWKDYIRSLEKFRQYAAAMDNGVTKFLVYVAFIEENNRVKRFIYAGQTKEGKRRFQKHIRQRKFENWRKLGVDTITFIWVYHGLSKNSANALETALQMLLLTRHKKRLSNTRFDAWTLAQHGTLGEDFRQSVTTLLEAASITLILGLQHNKRHRYSLADNANCADKEGIALKKLFDEYAFLFEQNRLGVIPSMEQMTHPNEFRSLLMESNHSDSSQKLNSDDCPCSQFSDKSFSAQQIVDDCRNCVDESSLYRDIGIEEEDSDLMSDEEEIATEEEVITSGEEESDDDEKSGEDDEGDGSFDGDPDDEGNETLNDFDEGDNCGDNLEEVNGRALMDSGCSPGSDLHLSITTGTVDSSTEASAQIFAKSTNGISELQQQDESERNMRKRKMQNGEGILPSKNVDEDENTALQYESGPSSVKKARKDYEDNQPSCSSSIHPVPYRTRNKRSTRRQTPTRSSRANGTANAINLPCSSSTASVSGERFTRPQATSSTISSIIDRTTTFKWAARPPVRQ